MKGKIFAETNNIFQDQAKILFNYYQQMAEKIVIEEERIEKEIEKLKEETSKIELSLSTWFKRVMLWFSAMLKKTKTELEETIARTIDFQKMHKEIFKEYKVSKIGIAYVPVADQIKYDNKSFIVDHTGMVSESEVKLQMPKQNDLLIETISSIESLSAQAPLVESSNEIEEIESAQYSSSMQQINQHDYFGKLERSLKTISFCMDDLDVTSVSLPLVANESNYLNFINEFATNEAPQTSPIFNVFDTDKYKDDIAKFQELNKLKDSLSKHSTQFEDVLRGLMVTMADSVQAISSLKIASTDKIVLESNKILYKILKAPYNHYSPVLEQTEIERIKNENFNYAEAVNDYVPFDLKESSKVKYNLLSDTWTAEDGSSTNAPFGVHQIHQEIVAPIVQNLMNETRIERMKIYNHIKDQKISYLNKWHQDTMDFYGRNRAESADLINLMRASLRDYVAAGNTLASLKKTEDSMAQSGGSLDSTVVESSDNSAVVFEAFEVQSKEFQKVQLDFENYMELLKEDIDIKATKFEHIDYYDALLRDGNPRDIAVAGSEVHELEDRRKPLITVNPLFAKTSELPPIPNVESIIFDHSSLDLPTIAKSTLKELDEDLIEVIETIPEEISADLTDESLSEFEGISDDSDAIDVSEGTDVNQTLEDGDLIIEEVATSDEELLNLTDENDDNQNTADPIVDTEDDENIDISSDTSSETEDNSNTNSPEESNSVVDFAVEIGTNTAKEKIAEVIPVSPEITGKAVDFLAGKGMGFLKNKFSKSDTTVQSSESTEAATNTNDNVDKSADKPTDIKAKFSKFFDKKSGNN